jgi:transglutaminase-like putative cysteine protease
MRLKIAVELDYNVDPAADVLLQVEVAAMHDQRILSSDLRVSAGGPIVAVPGEDGIGQRTWAPSVHILQVNYDVEVEIDRPVVDLAALPGTPVSALPAATIPYLLPSRFCEVEQLLPFVEDRWPGLAGGPLAAAIVDWVRDNIAYRTASSSGLTTAIDTLHTRRGVCRDFAHLVVALARAGQIPARCVAAYAPGVDPPDFHAVAELWLDGGWHLVDATGMSSCGDLARVAVGRDATDIAFMTVFGQATMHRQSVSVRRI